MLDLHIIPEMFRSVPCILGLGKAHINLKDPHKDADAFLAADEETREVIRLECEERLKTRIRRLGREAVDRRERPLALVKAWQANNPERTQAATLRWRENHPEKYKAQQKRARATKRIKVLKTNIESWANKGLLIVLGRDLDIADWVRILTEPETPTELEARTDFIIFLQHRGVHSRTIAKMLGTPFDVVRDALTSRAAK